MTDIDHLQDSGYLGIMICESSKANNYDGLPFSERNFYRRLCLHGPELGLRVFVFSPCRIDWALHKVWGYVYSSKANQWLKLLFPLPDLVYNRCFYRDRKQFIAYRACIHKMVQLSNVRFLGRGLKGKWDVQQDLQQEPDLQSFLPPTEIYRSYKTIVPWLKTKQEAFLKPQGGSQGRGILHVVWEGKQRFLINGRDRRNQTIHMEFNEPRGLFQWIHHFIQRRKYIIQPYLTLTNRDHESFDIRSLVQKNGSGLWHITGIAVRCGKLGSITSNLHGGGRAEEVKPFLQAEFGELQTTEIIPRILHLSLIIPPVLEKSHGQLFELGIDFGVDHEGHVWILEVNSKPGRAVFARLKNRPAVYDSITNPIRYARFILDKPSGG